VTTVHDSPWTDRAVDDADFIAAVNAPVVQAVAEVRAAFPENQVHAWPDGQGGARVVVESIELGPGWAQQTSWLGFDISYVYPDADCYPHYARPDLQRTDGHALVPPVHGGNLFADQPAVMVSRRSNRRDLVLGTAARKALSVVSFLQEPS
jgi:hypothetical protein